MASLVKKIIGNITLSDKVDITDPCYNRNTWCRINDVSVKPGRYTCVAWISGEGRVGILGVYRNGRIPHEDRFEAFGAIGVDAGLAGVFNSPKPDYDGEAWSDFCDSIRNGNAWIKHGGFFTSSGYGDGCYTVSVHRNRAKEIDAIEIRFM